MTQAERTRTIKYKIRTTEYFLRVADGCCTDEGTRRRYQNEEKKNEKRKVGSKAQKQARKSYSRRLHSNKSSGLCYKAEKGTLPHHLPSSSCSRRQRYQVSLLPLSTPPPPREQMNKSRTKLPGLGPMDLYY